MQDKDILVKFAPDDVARYTANMIASLHHLALKSGLPTLAHLLELSLLEAKHLTDAGLKSGEKANFGAGVPTRSAASKAG